MKTALLRTLLTGLIFAISTLVQAQTIGLDKVIAIVNDEAITMSEYQAKVKREQLTGGVPRSVSLTEIDQGVLENMVDERIQSQIADLRGIVVTDAEVDFIVNEMATRNDLSVSQLYAQLDSQGVTVRDFRSSLEEQRAIQRVVDATVNSRIVITEQEVDYHLQSHRELYATEETYELSHLFISTKDMGEDAIEAQRENIENIKQALNQGMEFDKAVNDFSDGEDSQTKGYIGWRKDDQLPEIFLQALRDTPIGGVTDIIQSGNGFHILKIHGKEGDLKIVTQHLVRHILIQPRKRDLPEDEAVILINDIRDQILAGEDFGSMARINSDDENSASSGGSLGWINPGDTAPNFEKIMREVELNTVSPVIRTQFGLHLLEVSERRKRDISQDLARQSAYAEIFRRKSNEMFKVWFNRIKDGAYIEYLGQG